MKKLILPILFLPLLWSCGGGDGPGDGNAITGIADDPANQQVDPIAVPLDMVADIANGFCANQRTMQIMSTSLLSAYSPKGNQPDTNYCGGTANLVEHENSLDFEIHIDNYCVEARGQQVNLNGDIYGTVESGANFITSVIDDLGIVGTGVNMVVTGNTWDGRDDDMFVTLNIDDNANERLISLQKVNIKKGEIDFGFFSFGNVGPIEFKFIKHFNADNTEGQIFIYGEGEQLIIMTGDNGEITTVYKENKQDPGTLVDTNCAG